MQKYVMEAMGTFFLVLAIGLTGNAFVVGIILSALIYLGRSTCGAHFNPAVSFAFYLRNKLSLTELGAYSISQLFGAFIAAVVVYLFSMLVYYVEPPSDTNLYQQISAEVLFTFFFVLMMLVMSLKPILRKNHLFGFIIGLTYAAVFYIGSPISGGTFNPALSFSTALVDFIHGGNSYYFLLLYILSPLAGGSIAATVYAYFENNGS